MSLLRSRSSLLAGIVGMAVLLAFPVAVDNAYYIHLVETIMIYAILLFGLDIVVGYTGQVSLGHAGLFGIGAYTAGVFVFNRYLLKHCDDHPGAVCMGAGLLYMVTFLLLCFMVKEGEYPPPEPRTGHATDRLTKAIAVYVRECFSLPFYWKIYLYNLFFMIGRPPTCR